MDGVLVIDKPTGPTSFDVVRRVRSLLKVKKVGHTGTLDPMATGVLPVCLGEATKVAGFITEGDKAYDAVIRLGQETDTQDACGKVTAEGPVPNLSKELLEAVLEKFRGTLLQTPPMYSAVKVDGKRLYELARAGEEVVREPRPVTVYSLVLRDFSATELTLSVRCSKGFFVRTLSHDVGKALGCGGHLKALRRTQSGPFVLAQAIPLEKLLSQCDGRTPEQLAAVNARLVPIVDALSDLPAVEVSPADVARVLHGVPLEGYAQFLGAGKLRVMAPDRQLLAIAEVDPSRRLRYVRVLAQP